MKPRAPRPIIRVLPNGVRIAFDPLEGVRSCAIGIWAEIGSRLERPPERGLTHFIEHMLFKGTPRFDALQLADELNRLGGNINAHTSQEAICLNARCVDEKTPQVLDLLSEMLLDSTFPEEEIRRERNVILEEYKLYEDNPDEVVFDQFFRALWPASPLGLPVIGNPGTIRKFARPAIGSYLSREFDPSRVLIVVAGNFDLKACGDVLRGRFGAMRKSRSPKRLSSQPARAASGNKIVARDVEQVHFCFGAPGPHRGSPERFPFGLMNMVLGGGMSSRLFKEVREKRGLAYSIQSFAQPYRGAGSFAVAGSTSPATLGEVLKLCRLELDRICEEKVGKEELNLAREQIIDSILMDIESTSARMGQLSNTMLTFNRAIAPEETVEKVKAVTPEDVLKMARKYIRGSKFAGAFIGPKGTKVGLR